MSVASALGAWMYLRRVVANDRVERRFVGTLLKILLGLLLTTTNAHAWGDKGHQVIAHIAWHYLTPTAREKIDALLQHDNTGLTERNFASESNWADEYRDSDRNDARLRFDQTKRWHYINLDLKHADLNRACYNFPKLKAGQSAADGPAKACIVDKIEQFARELKNDKTDNEQRLRALQFLIHFVGDLHQPLHASDNDDEGGNSVKVSAKGFKRGSLHGYWDGAVINQLGRKPDAIARKLIAEIDVRKSEQWRRGTARDWALESLAAARDTAYGQLPASDADGIRRLDLNYTEAAKTVAARQLKKAGVRLAAMLEQSL